MVRTWPRISSVTKFCFRHFSSGFFDLVQWWRLLQIKELLYYNWARDCAHATVVEIWCVEEVGDHHGQEANKWTFGSGLLLCQEFRGRCEEMAWKRRSLSGKESGHCDFYSTCVDCQHTYRHQKHPLGWVKTGWVLCVCVDVMKMWVNLESTWKKWWK